MTNLTENHFCNQLVHKQNETIRQPELGGEGRRNPIHAVSWVILQFRQKSAAFLKLEYSSQNHPRIFYKMQVNSVGCENYLVC